MARNPLLAAWEPSVRTVAALAQEEQEQEQEQEEMVAAIRKRKK